MKTATDGCPEVEFCGDERLGYCRSRTRFEPGLGLSLDESYRLAHLPLVAPDHADIIDRRDGKFYDRGRHPAVSSLVMPVPYPDLAASAEYRALEAELRTAPFAAKIAWDVEPRRREMLHATICGSLAIAPDAPPIFTREQCSELASIGPVRVELRGLFSGNVNVGRLYLRAYPECRAGVNLFQFMQRSLGRRETDLYLVGLHNLTDHLTPHEARALSEFIERWWHRRILRLDIRMLWLIWSKDDLVLDAAIAEELRLVP